MKIEVQHTFEPLVSNTDPSFDEFYRIYVESMPRRERKSRNLISAIAMSPDYNILLVKRNSVPIGFSVLFIPANESFCLLEYMAIDSMYRNLGIGKDLFLRTFQDVASNCRTVHVLLEIDSDREQSADHEIRKRRERFYRRLGCLRIDRLSYLLPMAGEGPLPMMDLMVYLPNRKPLILKSQLEHWLKVMYKKVYNCSEEDPRIIQMLETLSDPITLV